MIGDLDRGLHVVKDAGARVQSRPGAMYGPDADYKLWGITTADGREFAVTSEAMAELGYLYRPQMTLFDVRETGRITA